MWIFNVLMFVYIWWWFGVVKSKVLFYPFYWNLSIEALGIKSIYVLQIKKKIDSWYSIFFIAQVSPKTVGLNPNASVFLSTKQCSPTDTAHWEGGVTANGEYFTYLNSGKILKQWPNPHPVLIVMRFSRQNYCSLSTVTEPAFHWNNLMF